MWFGVLGPLEVRDSSGALVAVPPQKPTRLLALLLASVNDRVSTDRILDVLWDGDPPSSARSNVQVYIHRLRNVLGEDRIEHHNGAYKLAVAADDTDAGRFEALASAGAYREALTFWRGEAYAGVTDMDLVREEATRLTEMRLSTLEKRIDEDLGRGLHAQLVAELTGLVARHPLRERFPGQLMLALYRSGRASEALQVFYDLRSQMVDALGIEPGRPLRELQQAILTEDRALELSSAESPPPAPQPAPAELPPATGSFTGRSADLEEVRARLTGARGSSVPVVAITGPGGIGKSTLAVRAAHDVAAAFPDGQLYLNLQGAAPGIQPLEPRTAVDRLLRSLGDSDFATPRDLEEASGRLRTLTAKRRLLLVLDDVVDDTQVRPLLPGGAESAVLITSRGVPTSVDGTVTHQLSTLSREESTTLLARVTGAHRLETDPGAAEDLARLCGHLPLALSIAGAKLARRPNWPLRELVRRMTDEQRRLDELELADRAVRATFAVSSDDLGADGARMFRLLGLLAGPDVGVSAAAALADRTEADVEALLDQLVDAQLADSPAPGRYRLHDLLRLFAREQADVEESEEDRAAAVRRVLHCYLATARNAELIQTPVSWRVQFVPDNLEHPGCTLSGDADIGRWLSSEITNLLAAARQAAALPKEGPPLVVGYAAALFAPMNTRGRWYELRNLIEIGLEATHDEDLCDGRAMLLTNLGWIDTLFGRSDRAIPRLDHALSHWQGIGDCQGEATTHRVYARALGQMGRSEDALEHAHTAREMYADLGVREGRLDCLIAIGLQNARLGRLEEATSAHEEAIAIAERHGDLWHLGVLRGNLADLRRRAGDLSCAIEEFRHALQMDEESGNAETYFEAEHLWGLGRALHESNDTPGARRCWDRSAYILRELGLIDADELTTLLTTAHPDTPDVIARQL